VKRTEALHRLSRQHHQGLAVALQLKRADEANAPAAREAFLDFWQREGRTHFRAEEEVLLPAFARRASADHEAVVRVLVEHVDLRRRAAELGGGDHPTAEALHDLWARLEAHIRHEERVLFRLIEEALPPTELERVAVELERAEAGDWCG
jgi:iron-sulfur cluster repair protein YtfE (RIC family)